jgi:hypothetical protein
MKDKTKDSVNTHLKAKEMRGEIEPTHGAQVKLGDDVAYVLNQKEAIFFCGNLYGMSFPIGYAAK